MEDQTPGQVIVPNNGNAAQSAPSNQPTSSIAETIPPQPLPQAQPESIMQQPEPIAQSQPIPQPMQQQPAQQPQILETPPVQPMPVQQPTELPPEPAPQPTVPTTEAPAPVFQQIPQDDFASPQLDDDVNFAEQNQEQDTISWTASEYIAHQKSKNWYIGLGVATAALLAVVYVVANADIISMAAILLAAVVAGMYAGRPPKTQQYIIGPNGISIGQKVYAFDQLRSFSIIEEGAFSNITFMPMKRFMPAVSIYYDPADEEKIVTALSQYLPMENRRKDAIDRLTSRIKF